MAILAVGAMVYVLVLARRIGLQSLALLTVLCSLLRRLQLADVRAASCRPTTSHSDWPASIRSVGILGNLVSPSRGLLVFVPFVALIPSWPWSARAPDARGCDC